MGATATTAASGGSREELLGPRPAGCERQRSRRWEPQPGLGERSETERASPSPESRRTAISRFFERAKLCPNFSIHAGNRAIRAGFIDFSPLSYRKRARRVLGRPPPYGGGGYRFTPSGLSAGSGACPDRCNAHHPCRPGLCKDMVHREW